MNTGAVTIGLGILIIIIGIVNMTGNISTLHSYHRHRVRPEDIKPFGRLVGLGTMLCGVGCIVFGILSLIFDATGNSALLMAGTVIMISLLGVGLAVSILAIIKYNKGLF